MKKQLLFIVAALLPLLASAEEQQPIEIGGVYYNLIEKTKTAEVTQHPMWYTGSIVIPENVRYEGEDYTVTAIGELAFSWAQITSVSIPATVKTIDNQAFFECFYLPSIVIPSSVTSIGTNAFRGCRKLQSISIPASVPSIENGTFLGCTEMKSVEIPNSIQSIGIQAFEDCLGLTTVTIPASVKSLANFAFKGCSNLETVTIGSGMEKIEYAAFADCFKLTDVYCHATKVPNANTDAFDGSYISFATLHVPAGTDSNYRQQAPWNKFKSVVVIGQETTPNRCATPTISYSHGELRFECATPGAQFVSEITNADVRKHYDSLVQLTATYHISVYATLDGYDNSEVTTATLCWIDSQPAIKVMMGKQTDIETPKAPTPVLVSTAHGSVTVKGVAEGTPVSVYNTAGQLLGSATATNATAQIATKQHKGEVAIVKMGEQAVKVVVE